MDDIDCTKALHALYEFLDGELTLERRQYIELHLNGCPHCFSAFDFEAELRMVLRSRLQIVDVPAHLQTRIYRALENEGLGGLRPPPAGPGFGLGQPGTNLTGGFGSPAGPFG